MSGASRWLELPPLVTAIEPAASAATAAAPTIEDLRMRAPWGWGWECPPLRAGRPRGSNTRCEPFALRGARLRDPLAQHGGRLVDGRQRGDLARDALRACAVGRLVEQAAHRVAESGERLGRAGHGEARAERLDALAVAELVGEAGDDDRRHAGRERHSRRAG